LLGWEFSQTVFRLALPLDVLHVSRKSALRTSVSYILGRATKIRSASSSRDRKRSHRQRSIGCRGISSSHAGAHERIRPTSSLPTSYTHLTCSLTSRRAPRIQSIRPGGASVDQPGVATPGTEHPQASQSRRAGRASPNVSSLSSKKSSGLESISRDPLRLSRRPCLAADGLFRPCRGWEQSGWVPGPWGCHPRLVNGRPSGAGSVWNREIPLRNRRQARCVCKRGGVDPGNGSQPVGASQAGRCWTGPGKEVERLEDDFPSL
jgi:hypothetical protein